MLLSTLSAVRAFIPAARAPMILKITTISAASVGQSTSMLWICFNAVTISSTLVAIATSESPPNNLFILLAGVLFLAKYPIAAESPAKAPIKAPRAIVAGTNFSVGTNESAIKEPARIAIASAMLIMLLDWISFW